MIIDKRRGIDMQKKRRVSQKSNQILIRIDSPITVDTDADITQ